MAKYFKKQSLPASNETELPDAVTREANKAVENVIEGREAVELAGQSESILTSLLKLEQKIAKYVVQCGNAVAVKHFVKEFPTL